MTTQHTQEEELIKQFREKVIYPHNRSCIPMQEITTEAQEKIESFLRFAFKAIRGDAEKIDWSIDVRYEEDPIKAFNKFIKKWCGSHYPHLIDTDEQDGQFMREKIEKLIRSLHSDQEDVKSDKTE